MQAALNTVTPNKSASIVTIFRNKGNLSVGTGLAAAYFSYYIIKQR
jgi:hypothetical protein